MTQSISLPLHSGSESGGHSGGDPFAARLHADGQALARRSLRTLQLNVGKMCNLACHHCHVESGPGRTEIMTWETMGRVLGWLDEYGEVAGVGIVDLTGGAPEMNPHFRRLVVELKRRGLHILDRCNLTILLEAGYEDLPDFLAEHGVEVVASLPCYLEDNVDAQRGKGVFRGSIEALRRLNAVGYGGGRSSRTEEQHSSRSEGAGLRLDLVYNPVGYGLPPAQAPLEAAYRQHLLDEFGIVFDRLWTITNMPIKRFEHALVRDGKYAQYMGKLTAAHNAANVGEVMCRDLVSVGWRGAVYDCDFNQMLQMTVDPEAYGPGDDEHEVEQRGRKLWEYTADELIGRAIRTGPHCFGCTAGAGSSCTGALG